MCFSASTAASSVSNDTGSQPPSSNAIISVGYAEESSPSVEEAPSLQFSTPKQDDLNKQINIENEILNVFYKKRQLHQVTENDWKEIKMLQANLEHLKKKLNESKLFSRQRSKKYLVEHKQKLEALDKATWKKLTGRELPTLVVPRWFTCFQEIAEQTRVRNTITQHL